MGQQLRDWEMEKACALLESAAAPPGQFPGAAVLEILRGLYHYEKLRCVFDPRRNIALLPVKEIRKEHYTREYLRFYTLVRERYLYEFMRLGTEVPPFNTL